MEETRGRRGYLDWMRGLGVLIMIEAHVLDSWTRLDARQSWPFAWAMILGGFGAPLFLFLAGVSVSLSAGSKLRRLDSAGAAARAVMRRGWWVFGLAFLFRIQAWILGHSSPRTLLKVDILNIMGLSIVGAAALWGAFRTPRGRALGLAAAAAAVAFLSPAVRNSAWLDLWPQPLAAYLRPVRGSSFCLFPWAGFVLAGAAAGVLIDRARTAEREARLNGRVGAAGAALAAAAFGASWLPSPWPPSQFWGASPAYFFLRVGVMMLALGFAWLWETRPASLRRRADGPGAAGAPSPLQYLGRHSLFIYWIHVEMVYGLISLRIHKALSLPAAAAAFALFTLFMLACAAARDRFDGWRAGGRTPPGARGQLSRTGAPAT